MENGILTAQDGKVYAALRKKVLDITARPVIARVNWGRWIADCECRGAEMVSPSDPKFFCHSCNNAGYGGKARPVIFPGSEARAVIAETLKDLPAHEKNWQQGQEE